MPEETVATASPIALESRKGFGEETASWALNDMQDWVGGAVAVASGKAGIPGTLGRTGMCLKDRRVLSDLCAMTLEPPGCCQRENRLLQVPPPVG